METRSSVASKPPHLKRPHAEFMRRSPNSGSSSGAEQDDEHLPPPPHPDPIMGSEANRAANARVTGLKNARLSKIMTYKGCVKQKQLAKFAEEPKPPRPRPHNPTLSVTNEELHANHVFVLQIIKPDQATTLVAAELERAKALGRVGVAKIRDHPSRLDSTVGAKRQLNQRLQNLSKRYTQDLVPDSGVDYAVRVAVQPLLECARSPLCRPDASDYTPGIVLAAQLAHPTVLAACCPSAANSTS